MIADSYSDPWASQTVYWKALHPNKTPMTCPLSKSDFLEKAESLVAELDGQPMELTPKDFSTGSFGWNASGRLRVDVGGHPLQVMVSINATVLKSKQAPEKSVSPPEQSVTSSRTPTSVLAVPLGPLSALLPVNEVLFFPDEAGDRNLHRIFTFLASAKTSYVTRIRRPRTNQGEASMCASSLSLITA